jgi:hypothetical protein
MDSSIKVAGSFASSGLADRFLMSATPMITGIMVAVVIDYCWILILIGYNRGLSIAFHPAFQTPGHKGVGIDTSSARAKVMS